MPLFIDAFIADTMHLSAEETGAYLLLLMSMWRHNGSVPDDDKDNARITRLGMKKWRAMKPRLMEFITVENDRLTQKRLQKEWSYVKSRSQKQSKNSRARWDAVPNKNKDIADATAYPKKSNGISPHTHTHKDTTLSRVGVIANANDPPEKLPVKLAFNNWNIAAKTHGLPVAKALTPDRKKKIRARLKEHGIKGWNAALETIEKSEFLRGENDRAWRANLDFLCQPNSFNKLIEGMYDDI